ncbi:FAD/NAD(P)-binding protein [Desulfolithobacter sp.]
MKQTNRTAPRKNRQRTRQFAQMSDNIYLPCQARVDEIIRENDQVLTFVCSFEDVLCNKDFFYAPGQFMMVSMPHLGEAPISFSSSPTEGSGFRLTVRRAGRLTSAMHELRVGDQIGVRGPCGTPFPVQDLEGSNLLFVGGGIGMAPLRSVVQYALAKREKYGDLTVLYGARTPADICFKQEIERWRQQGITCLLTVDHGDQEWQEHVGLVTGLLDKVQVVPGGDKALVCGPGIMIRFVLEKLVSMGLDPRSIWTTLERHMKCGVGICGHCHFEERLVCWDGPVFSMDQLPELENL